MQIKSRIEQLTAHFYDWERRGRGWQVWEYPVELEPPFRPFFFHGVSAAEPVVDDGRRPTLFSSVADRIRDWVTGGREAANEAVAPSPVEDPEPEGVYDASPLAELQLTTPPQLTVSRETSEQLLLSLSYAAHPLSFEVVGTSDEVILQVAAREEDLILLRDQLRAHVPDGAVRDERGFLKECWSQDSDAEKAIVDFGLSAEFMLPLQAVRSLTSDPLTGVVGALSGLEIGEVGVLQVLFQATRHPWADSVMRSVRDGEGKPFFIDAPEIVALAKQKVARPFFAAVIRAAARSPTRGRAAEIVRALGGALRQFSSPPSNEFIPLTNEAYDELAHEEDLLERRTQRSGMLLNSAELVSVVHPPSAAVRSEKLKRIVKRTKVAPKQVLGNALVLGDNAHAGQAVEVSLGTSQRLRHTYVIGASGTGKSTLLLNMVLQDIQNGEGVGVLDPHGDLIDEILGHIPETRHEDVVLLDPGDRDFPIGFNILSAHSDLEKQLLSSDLVAAFRRLSTSWGDQMTSVLGNAILAFLESTKGGTLGDLRRFLVEPGFRKAFLPTVQDPEVVYFWTHEFPVLTGKPQAPLLTRLDTFLRPKPIRYMVLQKENRLDFASIMGGRKIFLAKLAQGAIGEENAYLLGTFLVSKLHQTAQSRQELPEAERRPFYLYLDEFHNFLTPSMAAILSGARKYGLGLVLAHQDLSQLGKRETGVLGAAISNPGTRICFRVGDLDAKRLEDGFATFGAADLQSLGVGEAICRVDQAQHDFNLATRPPPEIDQATAAERRKQLVGLSHAKYAAPRESVEEILTSIIPPPKEEAPAAPPEQAHDTAASSEPAHEATGRSQTTKPPPPRGPGKGGQQHRYLQQLIKRWAEKHGWAATIEKSILDGLGNVDVALEKGGASVACEISVTTTPEQELGNVQKCLAADFERVVVVLAERKALNKTRKFVAGRLQKAQLDRVRFLMPEELFAFLEEQDVPQSTEGEVRGYKVRVEYQSVSADEKQSRMKAISQVFRKAWERMREKE